MGYISLIRKRLLQYLLLSKQGYSSWTPNCVFSVSLMHHFFSSYSNHSVLIWFFGSCSYLHLPCCTWTLSCSFVHATPPTWTYYNNIFVHVINYFDNFRKYKQSNCLRKRGICASFLTVADTVKYDFFNVSLIIPDVISHIGIFLFYHMCRNNLHRTCRLIVQPYADTSILVFSNSAYKSLYSSLSSMFRSSIIFTIGNYGIWHSTIPWGSVIYLMEMFCWQEDRFSL